MRLKLFLFLFTVLLFSKSSYSQDFYRFRADYTLKISNKAAKPVMKMGRVFYDKNIKKIVLKNGFPVKENIIYSDTSIFFIRAGRVVNRVSNLFPVEFSIFHLALNGNLANYGLDKLGYILEEVKKDKGLVIASWTAQNNTGAEGKIIIATKNKELFSIIFLDKNEKIISKHIFHKYAIVKGLAFPTEVIRIYYNDGKELYELSTYRNIKVNETANDEFYNYQIPQ